MFKKISTKLKYLTFILVFIITGFAFSSNAFAATYSNDCTQYNTNDTLNLTTIVKMSNAGPFAQKSGDTFDIIASMSADMGCDTINATLDVQNNNDITTKKNIINESIGSNGGIPTKTVDTNYNVPDASGTYKVKMIIGVTGGGSVFSLPTVYYARNTYTDAIGANFVCLVSIPNQSGGFTFSSGNCPGGSTTYWYNAMARDMRVSSPLNNDANFTLKWTNDFDNVSRTFDFTIKAGESSVTTAAPPPLDVIFFGLNPLYLDGIYLGSIMPGASHGTSNGNLNINVTTFCVSTTSPEVNIPLDIKC